jgi:hypothetical protein
MHGGREVCRILAKGVLERCTIDCMRGWSRQHTLELARGIERLIRQWSPEKLGFKSVEEMVQTFWDFIDGPSDTPIIVAQPGSTP